ncbi:heterokaryon incompatibility protein-domain-containing protein [Biscogniauxia marginata]|nr:heterokaryon incompatibility protein-domain-containing protein [Biscogniauxia marginata]
MPGMKSLSARFSTLINRNIASNHLCDTCKSIEFEDKQKDEQPKVMTFRFGTLSDVRGRSPCPFCKMILDCIFDESIIHWQPTEYYEMHEIRVSQLPRPNHQDHQRFTCQPLPTSSRIVLASDLKGFDKIVPGKQIDFGTIGNWLDTCRNDHSKCWHTASEFNVDTSFFRAIDVHQLCITTIPITSEYVALSYVWGGAPPYKLIKGNKDELMTPFGLKAHWEEIPLTIRDSIELVRNLAQRYLWVDSICLTQDDELEKGKGIMAMDLVYEQSHFTIVAAGGIDANSGLPGVRPGSRTASQQIMREVLPGVNLVLRHTVDDLLRASRYNSRGWTFQEYYLSRRKLIFINSTVYFKCHEEYWSEVADGLPVWPDPVTEHGQVLHRPDGDVFHMLGQLLVKYSTRSLTNQSDAMDAMLGVCRRISDQAKCSLLLGIPVIAFDWFLLFYPSVTGIRRRQGFPSWAWSGWVGDYWYSSGSGNVEKWMATCTWIVWYKRVPGGQLTLVRDQDGDKNRLGGKSVNPNKRLFKQLCNSSCTEPSKWVESNHRPYPILQFWTLSVCFSLRRINRDKADNMMWAFGIYWTQSTYEVLDSNGLNRGFIALETGNDMQQSYSNAELILLADSLERVCPLGEGQNVNSQMPDTARFFWVLYIEWEDGVAERKGIGKIYRDAISSTPGPVADWKEIVLA